ncbi:hypothetical protein SIID45300_02837 [Candidatus Magnetaquicoccaceae bacterium FCR-1]|uniref:DUF3592 domain-containing protein n=1 Tax=Candidatus Magnetaquiglobus chichijimensis TaxID=3141448 RepID=A0ABQ0CC63_9PROT
MGHNLYLLVRNLALFLGGFCLVIFLQPLLKYVESSNWPQAEGTIVQSDMRQDGAMLFDLLPLYRVEIVYRFKSGDTEYLGTQLDSDPQATLFLFERFARVTVDRYPVGKTVQTHYNPNNPAEAFIARSVIPGLGFFWVIGSLVIFLVAAIIMWNKAPLEDALEKTFNKSLRPNGRDRQEIFKGCYPKAVYNPPPLQPGPENRS